MRFSGFFVGGLLGVATASICSTTSQTTEGIYSLIKRRLPQHAGSFHLSLADGSCDIAFSVTDKPNDSYTVTTTDDGKVHVEGNSVSALASGLHRYLSDVVHVDIYWFIGNRLDLAPHELPRLDEPIKGSSVVPWRYDLNTVTFSYTTAFWTWEDWQVELDWMALRGINLPLAWVGYEKLLVELFQDIGLTDEEITGFLSGPAFQAWNRFGNIQGSWGGDLPYSWIEDQFELQKKIVPRMVELGMTPVLPAFTGFVPRAIDRVLPNASVINAPQFAGFPEQYTEVSFLETLDENFPRLQKSFISKQQEAYGNVTHIYTLDQYNGMNPSSGEPSYLRRLASHTIDSLKAADPDAVWMMQGWIFYIAAPFWTNERIEAYLSGVQNDSDMIILDFYAESGPQWQRTNSFFGKPWIWCMLHAYGGNMELYGQVMNITRNPIQALADSDSLVGFGLTPDAQEGNEALYDLLLEQAWSETPINVEEYFHDWATNRYAGSHSIPEGLYKAWDILATTVYNNTNSTYGMSSEASILTKEPSLKLSDYVQYDLTRTSIDYDPAALVQAWKYVFDAGFEEPALWWNPCYKYDLVDISRQVLANSFLFAYTDLVDMYTSGDATKEAISVSGAKLITTLYALDTVLSTNENFRLSSWLESARASATKADPPAADYYEYSARNLITLWGPNGEISDSACKEWGGLVSTYYVPRWEMFLKYIESTPHEDYNASVLHAQIKDFELEWQHKTWGGEWGAFSAELGLQGGLQKVVDDLPDIFTQSQ